MAHITAKFTINDDRKDRCAEIREVAQQVAQAFWGREVAGPSPVFPTDYQ